MFVIEALILGGMVALGLLLTFWKCSWRARIWMLSHPVKVDLLLSVLLFILHGGTLTGGMAAAIAALFCSIVLGALRWLFGYMDSVRIRPDDELDLRTHTVYLPGVFDKYNAIWPTAPRPTSAP